MSAPQPMGAQLPECRGPLASLLERARRLNDLDRALRRHLGDPLARHCRLANVEERRVVLETDSPAWVARLRYRSPEILEFLRRQRGLEKLERAELRVSPAAQTRTETRPRAHLSPRAAGLLRDVADATEDPALKRALRRLSRRAGEPPS